MEDSDTASEAKTLEIKIARGQNGSESSGGVDVVSLFPAEMHTLAHCGGSALTASVALPSADRWLFSTRVYCQLCFLDGRILVTPLHHPPPHHHHQL